jgi:hypothetical protein
MLDLSIRSRPRTRYKAGSVAGSSAKPETCAPSSLSQRLNQLPLKPVCPVMKTRRLRQKFGVMPNRVIPSIEPTNASRVLAQSARGLQEAPYRVMYPSVARNLHEKRRETDRLWQGAPWVRAPIRFDRSR